MKRSRFHSRPFSLSVRHTWSLVFTHHAAYTTLEAAQAAAQALFDSERINGACIVDRRPDIPERIWL